MLDLSASYQVSDTFGVRLQVNNLTERTGADHGATMIRTGSGRYDIFGRRALLDFTFKF